MPLRIRHGQRLDLTHPGTIPKIRPKSIAWAGGFVCAPGLLSIQCTVEDVAMQFGPANSEPSRSPRLRMRLKPAAESAVRQGHPWVYDQAVRDLNRPGEPGELAVIYDRKDEFLAVGLYDPVSPIRVRVLASGKPVTINDAWWEERLDEALEKRRGILDSETNGCRLLYGESDYWPGLVVDQYATTLVMKLYAALWLPHAHRIADLLMTRLKPERIVLRLSRNIAELASERPYDLKEGVFRGTPLEAPVVFQESGLQFEAEVLRGQKTGFFLDQRENRRFVAGLARGKTVLNTFSFSGAFSLYAARAGAIRVTDVDISQHALDSSRQNFELNSHLPQVAACKRDYVKADVLDWLGKSSDAYDIVILDPPSFARREAERAGALEAYSRLAVLGVGRLARAGVLAACSCSAHVSTQEFFDVVRAAAQKSGRKHRVIRTSGHPPDHAARFPEAEYLKAIFLAFDAA